MTKKISFLGEELTISFNMATEIAYEEVSGEPFDVNALSKTKNTAILYLAAILANNPKSEVSLDDILFKASLPEIAELRTAVLDCMGDWMRIPIVMKEEKKEKNDEEQDPKND